MSSPFAGEYLTAEALRLAVGLRYVKTTDKTVNNTTTYSADAQLTTTTLAASTKWAVQGLMIYTAAIVAEMKFGFSGPTGFSVDLCPITLGQGLGAAGIEGTVDMGRRDGTTAAGIPAGGGDTSTKLGAWFAGTITIAGTAGAVAVNIAQINANASDAKLYANSWILLTKLS